MERKSPSYGGQWRSFLFLLSTLLLCLTLGARADQNVAAETVHAHVDSLSVEGGKLVAGGWVASTSPSRSFSTITIWLDNTRVYNGPFEHFDRPDVASGTGHPDWLGSGWRLQSAVPYSLSSGDYRARAFVTSSDGRVDELNLNPQYARVHVDAEDVASVRKVWNIRVTIAFLVLLVAFCFWKAEQLASLAARWRSFRPETVFAVALSIAFSVLIGLGVTGSSFPIGLQSTAFVEARSIGVFGEDRGIRSDEWLVSTPLSLAQANHDPAFPIVNSNLGSDGQNMLIVGMTGAPVAHPTAIAKPATWGYFFFDTKRAMSWSWYFPVFACLIALWGVLQMLCRCGWRQAFLLSLWFSSSAYVVAWSNWPAYAVLFPSLCFLLSTAILRGTGMRTQLGLGALLGIALAGFFLVLYPPWQISIALVFFAILVGVIVRDKLYTGIDAAKIAAFSLALSVFCVFVYAWWADAHEAVAAMMDTVYPGQRMSITGGGTTLSRLLRGFTNTATLDAAGMSFMNQSEIASFFYFLLPIAFVLVYRTWKKSLGAVEIALAATVAWILLFMFVGFPLELANFSLWARVPPNRADLALGLANVMLCGALLTRHENAPSSSIALRFLALVVAGAWAAVVAKSISAIDPAIATFFPSKAMILLCVAVAVASYSLVLSRFWPFIVVVLGGSFAATWNFNPVNIAPTSVSPADFVRAISKNNPRLLVLETQTPAMYYLASGMPVTNGSFYYPSRSLWERLDPGNQFSSVHNRYQHLLFSGATKDHPGTKIELMQVDVVKVVVDMSSFDFRLTGAGVIASPAAHEGQLRMNPSVEFVEARGGWSWFRVRAAED